MVARTLAPPALRFRATFDKMYFNALKPSDSDCSSCSFESEITETRKKVCGFEREPAYVVAQQLHSSQGHFAARHVKNQAQKIVRLYFWYFCLIGNFRVIRR